MFTGNPAGSCSVMKSLSLEKWAFPVLMSSMIGISCS